MALPGSGKSYDEFRASDLQCRQMASRVVGGQANDVAVRNAVIGTAVGAVAGAAIGGRQGAGVGAGAGLIVGSASGAESSRYSGYEAQDRYDETYVQCMYANGHKVPVSASVARSLMQRPVVEAGQGNDIPPPPSYPPPSTTPPDYFPPPPASR